MKILTETGDEENEITGDAAAEIGAGDHQAAILVSMGAKNNQYGEKVLVCRQIQPGLLHLCSPVGLPTYGLASAP